MVHEQPIGTQYKSEERLANHKTSTKRTVKILAIKLPLSEFILPISYTNIFATKALELDGTKSFTN